LPGVTYATLKVSVQPASDVAFGYAEARGATAAVVPAVVPAQVPRQSPQPSPKPEEDW